MFKWFWTIFSLGAPVSVNLWYLNKPDEDWYWPVEISQLNSISRCLISPCKGLLDCNLFNSIYFDWSRCFWIRLWARFFVHGFCRGFFFTLTKKPIEAVKKRGNRTKVTGSSGNNSIAKESFFFAEIKSNQTFYCKVADKDEHNTRRLLLDLRCLIETETGAGERKKSQGTLP